MQVDPEFAIGVVLDARVAFVMEPVKSTRNDVVQLYVVDAVHLQPLTVLYELKDVRSGPNAIWQSAGCISGQAEQSDNPRSIGVELRMIPWFVI